MVRYDINNKMTEKEFEELYGLLSAALPVNERRSFQGQFGLFTEEPYKLYAKKTEQEELLGFLAAWEFQDLRFIEHFAVSEKARGGGIGGAILEDFINMDNRSVVLEVEYPETDMAKRRIGFYGRHGFYLNNFEYQQPPLNKGDRPLPLYLMTWPRKLNEVEFGKIKRFLYHQIYGLDSL